MKINLFGHRSIITIIIGSLIGWMIFSLAKQNIKIKEGTIYKIYDEIRRLINLELPDENKIFTEIKDDLNRRIIQDPELLKHRIKADVTYALSEYKRNLPKDRTNNINRETYKNLGGTERKIVKDATYYEFEDGTMGIRGSWVDPPEKPILIERDPNLRKWAFGNEQMIESVGTPIQKEILRQSDLPVEKPLDMAGEDE
jgi:hypothetical protein